MSGINESTLVGIDFKTYLVYDKVGKHGWQKKTCECIQVAVK